MEPIEQKPTGGIKIIPEKKNSIKRSIWKIITLLLVIGLAASLMLWKPWQANIKASDRTVTVNGQATITSEPDEYVFSPSYDFENSSQKAALTAITQRNNEIVAKLKSLGVADSKIQNSSSGYSNGSYAPIQVSGGTYTYTLNLTVTLDNKDLAQKVQDYLVSTQPTGQITPQINFSTAKQKQLENQARDKAETDARSRADQSAKNLGFRVAAVKSVQDGGFDNGGICGGGVCSGLSNGANTLSAGSASTSLSVQPGQNDLSYSVTVVYYIK